MNDISYKSKKLCINEVRSVCIFHDCVAKIHKSKRKKIEWILEKIE